MGFFFQSLGKEPQTTTLPTYCTLSTQNHFLMFSLLQRYQIIAQQTNAIQRNESAEVE